MPKYASYHNINNVLSIHWYDTDFANYDLPENVVEVSEEIWEEHFKDPTNWKIINNEIIKTNPILYKYEVHTHKVKFKDNTGNTEYGEYLKDDKTIDNLFKDLVLSDPDDLIEVKDSNGKSILLSQKALKALIRELREVDKEVNTFCEIELNE
jgi:hypothetical protein